MTTAVIHIFQPPEKPVWFSWWTEVATPIAFGPDGTLIDLGFESTLESGGGIVAQVEALRDLLQAASASATVDLIVSPVALDQLERAADGYERADGTTVPSDDPAPLAAAATLERLREIAASPLARLHAMPFAAPRLPALLSAGLKTHLDAHWRVGDETFERILGERPDPTVARPPGLAFDQASVDAMEARGVTTLLGAVDTVDRPPQDNDFAPPPAATLPTSSGGDVKLLLPDPGATSLLDDPDIREDPILAAHVLLGRARHDLEGAARTAGGRGARPRPRPRSRSAGRLLAPRDAPAHPGAVPGAGPCRRSARPRAASPRAGDPRPGTGRGVPPLLHGRSRRGRPAREHVRQRRRGAGGRG